MTIRERWIVYPLLLLAISMSLKEKLEPEKNTMQLKKLSVDQLQAGQIITPAIQGGTANFREVAGALIQGRGVQVVDPQGNPKVVLQVTPTLEDEKPNFQKSQGAITIVSGEGQKMITMGGGRGGGFIAVRSNANPQDFVGFGYQAGRTGMFWLDKDGKPQGFLKPQPTAAANTSPSSETQQGKEGD